MTVYLVMEYGDYDEGDVPLGVYSTLDAARKALAASLRSGCVYEATVDAEGNGAVTYVPDPPEPHWWDNQKAGN